MISSQRLFPAGRNRHWGSAALLLICLLLAGCGDVFRPVATPIASPGGDPTLQHRALVLNSNPGGTGTVTDIDVPGDSVMAVRDLGQLPVHAATLANSIVTYVANSGDDSISVFNTFSEPGVVPTVVALPAGARPVFVLPGVGDNLFIAAAGLNAIQTMSVTLNVLSGSIPVGTNPVALAMLPDGTRVYSINQGDGTVSVVTPGDMAVVATIRVGTAPSWAAISSDGAQLYVANRGSNSVSVIDTASATVTATIPVGIAPNFIIFDRALRRVYVTNSGSDSVSILRGDVQPATLLATVNVGRAPLAVAPLNDGTRVYVANSGANSVTVINTTNNTVLHTVTVGSTPVFLAAAPDNSKVMVVNRDSNNVSAIATATDTVVATIATASPRPVYVTITQ